MKFKLAIVVSHPIQHFCPQYASFAKLQVVQVKVFFASSLGLKKYFDPNFKKEISWNSLRLNEFEHQFLNGDQVLPSDRHLDAKGLEIELHKFAPNAVVIYGYFQPFQRRAYRWANNEQVPIAYISDGELRQQQSVIKKVVKQFFLQRFFSKISFFLSVGDANEQYYQYFGVSAAKFIRMHFPIDIGLYTHSRSDKDALRQQVRSQYNIDEQDVALCMVGKLVSWKNQDHLIEALRLLEGTATKFHLFLVGSGQEEERLQKMATTLKKSSVHFVGFIPPEKLPAYYAATDIYVHSAYREPHSIAISEAIFMGCPIIVSNRAGSYGETDDVQPGRNGFVYEFGKINELVERIVALSSHSLNTEFARHSSSIASHYQERAHSGVIRDLVEKLSV